MKYYKYNTAQTWFWVEYFDYLLEGKPATGHLDQGARTSSSRYSTCWARNQVNHLTKNVSSLSPSSIWLVISQKTNPKKSLNGDIFNRSVVQCPLSHWRGTFRTALGDTSPAFYQRMMDTLPMLSHKFLLTRWFVMTVMLIFDRTFDFARNRSRSWVHF